MEMFFRSILSKIRSSATVFYVCQCKRGSGKNKPLKKGGSRKDYLNSTFFQKTYDSVVLTKFFLCPLISDGLYVEIKTRFQKDNLLFLYNNSWIEMIKSVKFVV